MRRTRHRLHIVRNVDAIRLLASPLRQALVDSILANGPSSVAQLGSRLRRPADRLYYHVRLLEQAGLLVSADRSATATSEARFDVPGRPLVLEYDPSTLSRRRALGRVVTAILRSARADFARALTDKSVRFNGRRRELWAGRIEAQLSQSDVAALNGLVRDIHELMQRTNQRAAAGRKPYQFTWTMSPVTRDG